MFVPFASWFDVLLHADSGLALYYQAPLDTAPRPVLVRKAFKNGKLRLDAGEVVFTADMAHRERFYRRRTAADVTLDSMRADALRLAPAESGQTIDAGDVLITTTLHRLG
jgi:hypothetical protein